RAQRFEKFCPAELRTGRVLSDSLQVVERKSLRGIGENLVRRIQGVEGLLIAGIGVVGMILACEFCICALQRFGIGPGVDAEHVIMILKLTGEWSGHFGVKNSIT